MRNSVVCVLHRDREMSRLENQIGEKLNYNHYHQDESRDWMSWRRRKSCVVILWDHHHHPRIQVQYYNYTTTEMKILGGLMCCVVGFVVFVLCGLTACWIFEDVFQFVCRCYTKVYLFFLSGMGWSCWFMLVVPFFFPILPFKLSILFSDSSLSSSALFTTVEVADIYNVV